jgi:ribosomal protein S18 acetylase RimI-like enzyme
MKNVSETSIEKALIEDIEEILDLQKLAYISEAEIIDDFTISPLHQTIDEVISEFKHQVFLKVVFDNKIIGSVRTHMIGETCHIGKLIVDPSHQNIGIGTMLLNAAEKLFSNVERYELFTGQRSEKNLHIYKKNGYQVFKIQSVSEMLTLSFLEKINSKCYETD